MDKQTLDIYSDLLFANLGLAASTRFSDALNGELSHDKFSRFLNGGNYDGKTLWKNIKADVRTLDTKEKSVLSFDDTIVEKPYTKENPINCWHYAHDKGRTVKGINIISCLAVTSTANIPFSYSIVRKDIKYCDLKTKKVKRKSKVSKNELMRDIFNATLRNNVNFEYVVADSWYSCAETMEHIHQSDKKFVFAIKSNRVVYKTENDREKGNRTKLSEFDLQEGDVVPVFLNLLGFRVRIMKRIFTNENGTQGIL